MEKKSQININLSIPIILFFLSTSIPIYNGSIDFFVLIKFLGVFISSFCIGFVFLDFLKNKYSIRGDMLFNLSLYIGLIFLTPLLVLQKQLNINGILFISILLCLVINYFYLKKRRVTFDFNLRHQFPVIFTSLLTLILFANFSEIISAVPLMYKNYFQDFYWFTAMTSSIRDFDFTNSNFEEGVGIYHHVLGLFPAAFISALTKLSSHTSLWSVSMPIAIFTAYSSIVFIIQQFSNKIRGTYLFFALILFMLHFPLNPKCFINGNIQDAIWFGTAHTLPVLPTWAAVYCFSAILTMVILKSKEISYINVLMISLFSFLLAWAKITSIFVFYPFIFVFLVLLERRLLTTRQKILFLSLIPTFLLIKFYYSNSSAKFILAPGQIIIDNLNSYKTSLNDYVLAILMGFVLLVIWIGIKWLLLFNSTRLTKKISFSFLLTVVLCLFLQLILKIKSFDHNGVELDDSSYDIQQFMRSAFIYIDIFALLIFYKFLEKENKSRGQVLTIIGLPILYSVLVVVLLFSNRIFYFPNYYTSISKWDYQVINELKKFKHTRKAMVSNYKYSGQFISAHDIDNFYLSIENRNGGYTYSYSNIDKYKELERFLKGKLSIHQTVFLKKSCVKLIIATPSNLNDLILLTKKGALDKIPNTEWLFCLKE